MKRLKVGLVYGGLSEERKISALSAKNVFDNLDRRRYLVSRIQISKGNIPVDALRKIDLALVMVHGPGGEDGTIQGLLELLGKKYTGSGVTASSVAMNKRVAKELVASHGIRTPLYYMAGEKNIKLPGKKVVVKPASIGSSLGISIVSVARLSSAIKKAISFDKQVLVEQYIDGREFTVPVIGNTNPKALPVIEIRTNREFFDFKAKYAKGAAEEIVPAEIPASLSSRIQGVAISVHKLLGCRGLTRSDFIVDRAGHIYFLEINTIPGMTKNSLVPKSALAAGIAMPQLLDEIISLGLQ